ncbi:hypothetical protein KL938_001451 [Ogataea parapolymorpha]|nr:hypothetical protein KL938_001451 [Ogataea parapolymorpha]
MLIVEKAPPRKGPLSLTQLARIKCIQNAHLINDIGQAPYHLVEPILKKKTAKALRVIEEQSPQIVAHDDPLWQCLIQRDFSERPCEQITIKNGRKTKVPARELYEKYAGERELQRRTATQNLRQITRNLTLERNKNKVKAVDHIVTPKSIRKPIVVSRPRSVLLQRAMQQNKMRAQYLSQNVKKK